jgi:ATP-dependent DNA helicase RecG
MAIDDEIEKVLALEEGQHFEFKRAGNNSRAIESVVALANTGGGIILLGIEDPKKATGRDRLYGIEENHEAVDELQRLIRTRITPLLSPPLVEQPTFTEIPCILRDGKPGHIVLVQVNQSAAVHSLVGGATFARFGRTNQQLSAAEITDLSLRRGTRSVVDDPVSVSFDLLDTATWRQYAENRKVTRPLPEALRHVGLAKEGPDGKHVPTRAAVLLFAEEPNGLLDSKCTVRVFHYKGDRIEHSATTNLVRPPRTAGGPLIEQIRLALELTVNALASGIQVGPLGFDIVQKYPWRVLREAITNAVIHRDYRHSADIQIRIFDNRIEIESPGGFSGARECSEYRHLWVASAQSQLGRQPSRIS